MSKGIMVLFSMGKEFIFIVEMMVYFIEMLC